MEIDDFAQACHTNAKDHGFWDDNRKTFGEQIALMHSELSESLEFFRDGQPFDEPIIWTPSKIGEKPDGMFIELGDCVIRIFDTIVAYGHSPRALLVAKHEYNMRRAYQHGGKKI